MTTPSADVLRSAPVEVKGRMPWASNATLLCELGGDDEPALAVYKPVRGQRQLWDFPGDISAREVAAYELSAALGWDVVPTTVWRDDAPHGPGSMQAFIDADFEQHYFTLYEQPEHHEALRTICAFDLLANNTDRKSGHCLLAPGGRIYGIDNALCFHAQFKLRTVIWEFAGEPVPPPLLADVDRFLMDGIPDALARWLDPLERDALLTRARALVAEPCFPADTSGHRYPWPLV